MPNEARVLDHDQEQSKCLPRQSESRIDIFRLDFSRFNILTHSIFLDLHFQTRHFQIQHVIPVSFAGQLAVENSNCTPNLVSSYLVCAVILVRSRITQT